MPFPKISLRVVMRRQLMSAIEYQFVPGESPQPFLDPPKSTMARWPVETCIGAEGVRSIRRGRELSVWCVHRAHL